MEPMTQAEIVALGNRTDIGLDMLVASQLRCPKNLAEWFQLLLESEPDDPLLLNRHLSSVLATAIIRLASNERVAAAS